jgi:branched-chain amino acid aminotransferase
MRVTWFNGALAENRIAIDPQDRGLTLGDGVFETLLVLHGKPQWLDLHLARMARAAAELGLPFDRETVMAGISAILRGKDATPKMLRITLTRGRASSFGADGERPGLLIFADRFDPALMHRPLTLATAQIRRNEHAPSSRLKTLSYIDSILAAREVKGQADDALMLNTAGRVACSTIANVFVLKGRTLLTPSEGEGILPGIMRGLVLQAAGALGYDARECPLERQEFSSADAAFLTNCLRIVRPITHLDGQVFGNIGLTELVEAMKPQLLEGTDP